MVRTVKGTRLLKHEASAPEFPDNSTGADAPILESRPEEGALDGRNSGRQISPLLFQHPDRSLSGVG